MRNGYKELSPLRTGVMMKRKALVVSMALIAGMPGWAKAKEEMRSSRLGLSSVTQAEVAPDIDRVLARDEGSSRKAAEVLAQIKQMLRSGKREAGTVLERVAANKADMSLGFIDQGPGLADSVQHLADRRHLGDDPRTQAARPWGLALRMKF